MKKLLFAGLLSAAVLGGAATIPAQASCKGAGHCSKASVSKTHHHKKLSSAKLRKSTVKLSSIKSRKRVHVVYGSSKSRSLRKSQATAEALAIPVASSASQGNVVSLIKTMAPSQGVPTWFALRIAHVESNYNAHMRGAAGEYGVFQMKCATAKGIGFRGNCGALLDARTNVQWGLKHLALAIGKSGGNLRLAASKHNGGLGRRTEVASYVAKVF
jgi:soluble lytic murein transglycosylase-like protein